ncbi:NUDIX domain-containing protein [Microbacterium hominis]|uniref:NUDIX domain-containing protein n=1 Tax=Microbacterium hominis TaxID=162426 RepID=A0A7D4PXI5_9MICO|nr:NUDIX domain-containing protein [Microbacterium hominis]
MSLALAAAVLEPAQADRYRAFLDEAGEAALHRDGGREHVTASCFVFSPGFDRVLLCLHRKGGFWVQFGGHLESIDAALADAALREAREESGVEAIALLSTQPVDLDRHELSAGFGWCAAHWDVGFAAVVAPDAVPTASDESDDVAWFDVDAVPAAVPTGFVVRLRNVLDLVRRLG